MHKIVNEWTGEDLRKLLERQSNYKGGLFPHKELFKGIETRVKNLVEKYGYSNVKIIQQVIPFCSNIEVCVNRGGLYDYFVHDTQIVSDEERK